MKTAAISASSAGRARWSAKAGTTTRPITAPTTYELAMTSRPKTLLPTARTVLSLAFGLAVRYDAVANARQMVQLLREISH